MKTIGRSLRKLASSPSGAEIPKALRMIDGILRGERKTGNKGDEGETQRHDSQLFGHDFWVLFLFSS